MRRRNTKKDFKMKTAFLVIISSLLQFTNCSDNHTVNVDIGQSYNITCDIKNLKHVKACFLMTPSDQVKMLFSGARLDQGRITSVNDPTKCGAKVQNARKDDEGTWRCIVAIHTSGRTINKIVKIQVAVQNPVPDRQIQEPAPAKVINSVNFFLRSL